MDRVAFLVESTGARIGCLLNPETIVVRRRAGVKPRRSAGGLLTGGGLVDDPLLYVGGGTTEIELDLLFDVTVDGATNSSAATPTPAVGVVDPLPADPELDDSLASDVRTLTRSLQELTEKPPADSAANPSSPPVVRLIWGKGWNVPGVIVALAERFDYFLPNGRPQRSWLRMRLRRVADPAPAAAAPAVPIGLPVIPATDVPVPEVDPESIVNHELPGAGADLNADPADPPPAAERIDEIAYHHFGIADAWRLIASFNDLDDPSRLPGGSNLQIPPKSAWGGA